MRYLSSEEHLLGFLIEQKDGTLKNNGLAFENLVENLLNLEFCHLDWEKTKTSWDGAKDFIGRKNGIRDVWAECKMYKNALQLSVISKTLIMAINHRINRIIIFSWSKLTTGTLRELAKFSFSTGTNIQIFDDELLEILILKYIKNKNINKYFPNFNEPNSLNTSLNPEIEQFFSKDIQLDSTQFDHSKDETNPRSNDIIINTPCLFQIIVYPNTIEQTEIDIDLSKLFEKEHIIEVLNKEKLDIDKTYKITKKLFSGEIFSLNIYLAPSKYGYHEIPACDIFINKNKRKTNIVNFNVENISRPVLVGENVLQSLINFHSKISSNNYIFTTIIDGPGGVGKSRFLEECIIHLLKENYRICKLDGKDIQCKNFCSFVVELLTQLWRLPNPKIFKKEFNTFELQTITKDDEYIIHSYLYEIMKLCTLSEQVITNEIEKKIYHLFQEGFLKQSRIAIIIDNVQSLDNKSISLVKHLTAQTGLAGQNVEILAFNTEELIYSHEACSFYHNLKDELLFDNNSLFININEFSEKEVQLFVDSHLRNSNNELTFTMQYPLLYGLISKHIQPRPLDLYVFFFLLLDKKAVELDNGIFYIYDFDIFNNVLIGIEKIEDILIQRLIRLQENTELLDIIILLLYFGEIDIDFLIEKFNINYDNIVTLANGCWIKILVNNKIIFYHPKIERFIIENENNLIKTRGKVIHNLIIKNIDLEYYPLINFIINPIKNQILPKAIDELQELTTINSRNKLYAIKIYNFITRKESNVSPSIYLKAIQKLCSLIAENNSEIITEIFSHFNNILSDYIPKESEAIMYFHIIRQYASHLCSRDPYKSISVINKGLLILDKIKEKFSDNTTFFIKMNLNNRLSYCYRTIRDKDNAKKKGEEALKLAIKINDIPYTCLCYMDLGYIYYELSEDKYKLIHYWDEVIKIFNDHKEKIINEDVSIALEAMIAEAYIYAVKNNAYDKAINKTDEIIKLSKEHFLMNSEIHGILIKIIFEFKLNSYSNNDINTLIDSIIDRTLVTYNYKNQSKAYHLKAIALSKQKNKVDEAFNYYKYGIKILEKKEVLSVSDIALVWDFLYFSKIHDKNIIQYLSSSNLQNKIEEYNKIFNFIENKKNNNLFMMFADNEYNFTV